MRQIKQVRIQHRALLVSKLLIRKQHPNQPIHGIHGSDLGGMWVRSIYDESGWIYLYAVRRGDSISATSIRNWVRGQTTPIVERISNHFRNNEDQFQIDNCRFQFQEGETNAPNFMRN